MSLIDAARQALEALEAGPDVDPIFACETITALKAALDVGPPEHERLSAFQFQADRDTRLLMRAHKEALRQRDYWQEEAKRYAGNADFWRNKHKLTDQEIADTYIKWDATPGVSMADFARDIEKKLCAKNSMPSKKRTVTYVCPVCAASLERQE
jgi:hypothetical protein